MRWTFLAILLMAGTAFSQPNGNDQPRKHQQQVQAEQRGTDQSPFTVKILPIPDADKKAEEDEQHRQEKAEEDKKLTAATIWLARLTAVLALFTAALWYVTYRLSRDARAASDRQAVEMERSLALAERSADLAEKQLLLEGRQADIIEKQHAVGRMQFFATHRPKIIVRELILFMPTITKTTAGVRVVIANSGSGSAEITESHIELQFVENFVLLPLQPTEGDNPIGNVNIEPGSYVFREFGSNIGGIAFINEQNRQLSSNQSFHTKLWLRGFIVYTDMNNVRRRTAFCRGYDFKARRFRPGDDPDFEYQD